MSKALLLDRVYVQSKLQDSVSDKELRDPPLRKEI